MVIRKIPALHGPNISSPWPIARAWFEFVDLEPYNLAARGPVALQCEYVAGFAGTNGLVLHLTTTACHGGAVGGQVEYGRLGASTAHGVVDPDAGSPWRSRRPPRRRPARRERIARTSGLVDRRPGDPRDRRKPARWCVDPAPVPVCPRCERALHDSAPFGLCASCLFEVALESASRGAGCDTSPPRSKANEGLRGTGGGMLSDRPEACRLARTTAAVAPTAADWLAAGPTSTLIDSNFEVPAELADHPRYCIVAPIGRGGMGTVYLAEHRLMGTRVASRRSAPSSRVAGPPASDSTARSGPRLACATSGSCGPTTPRRAGAVASW